MKKCLISLTTLILVIFLSTNVYAATASISATASATALKKGDTFTVTVSASASSPIDGMYTLYDYDNTVLKLESEKEGEGYRNNSGTKEIYVTNNSQGASPTSGKLFTLTFKVLEDTTATKTKISFSESALHLNENNSINDTAARISDIEINIELKEEQGGEGEKQPEGDKEPEEKPSEDKKPAEDKKPDNSTSGENKLPQTGVGSITIIALAVLTISSRIFYMLYKRYKDI